MHTTRSTAAENANARRADLTLIELERPSPPPTTSYSFLKNYIYIFWLCSLNSRVKSQEKLCRDVLKNKKCSSPNRRWGAKDE